VLRRAVPAAPPPEGAREVRRLRFDQFELDLASHRLTRGEVEVPLTTGEFRLLRALLNRAHHVLSRDELMSALHGRQAGPFDRAIDVQLGRLRRKLGDSATQPRLIKAIRGEGYLFAADVEAA
jgi:two-component system OmpR family response regulator